MSLMGHFGVSFLFLFVVQIFIMSESDSDDSVAVSTRKLFPVPRRIGKLSNLTAQQAKYKRTVMYRKNRSTGRPYRTVYEEWEDNGEEIKNALQVYSPIPENEPRVNHTVSYDPDVIDDVTGPIKLFGSEEAADNYLYRSDNNENENESGENTSNLSNA